MRCGGRLASSNSTHSAMYGFLPFTTFQLHLPRSLPFHRLVSQRSLLPLACSRTLADSFWLTRWSQLERERASLRSRLTQAEEELKQYQEVCVHGHCFAFTRARRVRVRVVLSL